MILFYVKHYITLKNWVKVIYICFLEELIIGLGDLGV